MRRPLHRRRPAAVATAAAALAALLTLSACSSNGDGDGDSAADRSNAAGPSRSAVVPDRQTEVAPTGPAPSASASRGPVVPDAELKPVTGSFTKDQKAYLSGRVPKSMDPAAVLQNGQESCQRLERTAKRDRDAAVGALVAGDIPDAEAAVNHLCPAQKPLLATARTGHPDGTTARPAPGTYRALTTDPSCTWRALGSGGKLLASGPSTGAQGPVKATVPAGTVEFVSTSCYAWLPA
ncbi:MULTISPECIES: hypothetical protein [Streptomyces]|uniref:hypothetical protein n=1 Tax=Streptomyces TaxID=1883 RepID=UPI0019C6E786|nr:MULTISPECIES: hypothetical protein [Streptomyces]GGT72001.1 hypothetical protein GCM10010272_13890 [Streptomyces lateritius]